MVSSVKIKKQKKVNNFIKFPAKEDRKKQNRQNREIGIREKVSGSALSFSIYMRIWDDF